MKAKARHIKEKPNALNVSKAILQVILGNKLHLLSVSVVSLLRNGKFNYVHCMKSENIGTCGYLKNVT